MGVWMFSILVYGGFEYWCMDVYGCTGFRFVVYGCFVLGCTDVCEMYGCFMLGCTDVCEMSGGFREVLVLEIM